MKHTENEAHCGNFVVVVVWKIILWRKRTTSCIENYIVCNYVWLHCVLFHHLLLLTFFHVPNRNMSFLDRLNLFFFFTVQLSKCPRHVKLMVSGWCREQSSIFLMLKSQLTQSLSLHSLVFSCMALPRAHTHLFSLIECWGDEEWFLKLNLRDSILDSCCFLLHLWDTRSVPGQCWHPGISEGWLHLHCPGLEHKWGGCVCGCVWCVYVCVVCVCELLLPLSDLPRCAEVPKSIPTVIAAASSAGAHWVLLNLEQSTEPSANLPSLNPSIL